MEYDWIYDDITWCISECSYEKCERNTIHRLSKTGLFSAANLKGTESCPLYREEREKEGKQN